MKYFDKLVKTLVKCIIHICNIDSHIASTSLLTRLITILDFDVWPKYVVSYFLLVDLKKAARYFAC